MQTLDEAVGPTAPTTALTPLPFKRLRTSRSIYAMLTKRGKKDNKPYVQPLLGNGRCVFISTCHTRTTTGDLQSLSKTSPNLAAILARTASRTRKVLPMQFGQTVKPILTNGSSSSDYRPSSIASFFNRLSTYKLSTYGNKPRAIDAVAASKSGWINDGKDRLLCGICGVSWVLAGRDGMTREAGM